MTRTVASLAAGANIDPSFGNVTISDTIQSQPVMNNSTAILRCTEPITGYTANSNQVSVEVGPAFQEI